VACLGSYAEAQSSMSWVQKVEYDLPSCTASQNKLAWLSTRLGKIMHRALDRVNHPEQIHVQRSHIRRPQLPRRAVNLILEHVANLVDSGVCQDNVDGSKRLLAKLEEFEDIVPVRDVAFAEYRSPAEIVSWWWSPG